MNRFLPALVFLVVAAIGLGMSLSLYRASEVKRVAKFEAYADEAAARIVGRYKQHLSLLEGTKALFEATSGAINRTAFKTYVDGLDTEGRYDGIQGIGFARLIHAGNEGVVETEIKRNYGKDRKVWPETTDQDYRTPIVLLEPNDIRNDVALGYDMYSDPIRRAAMSAAFATDTPMASGPVQLVQEITTDKQTGFLIYVPFKVDNDDSSLPLSGFVYAPFRAGDLYHAISTEEPILPLQIMATDVETNITMFQSDGFAKPDTTSRLSAARDVDIGGRKWTLHIQADESFRADQFDVTPFVVAAVSLLLAVALALSAQSQIKALSTARAMHELSEKSLQERDLMLQEMKHRIKNSIARVLAMARQTARHSDDLKAFMDSYTARLQAMSTAQDVLTRSHWQRADLKELLTKELAQVFGDSDASYDITGPAVELDEKATQAFSLTFHELATNALKYGGVSEAGASLSVDWAYEEAGRNRKLRLTWSETGSEPVTPPTKKGFGTRLIDANIIGELNGSIERHYREMGLSIAIIVPAAEMITKRRWRRRRRAGTETV
ncbi:CHASE domain-containing protein [Martelella sp. HB161492]|uniref:CHASE domain-containing protein n=1 Tax=Martelella sp. HB161492 TaxID=2720726 RepID=UPI0015902978|nr:CHASE domain-containing protein [Martelella sp. HB161492]